MRASHEGDDAGHPAGITLCSLGLGWWRDGHSLFLFLLILFSFLSAAPRVQFAFFSHASDGSLG